MASMLPLMSTPFPSVPLPSSPLPFSSESSGRVSVSAISSPAGPAGPKLTTHLKFTSAGYTAIIPQDSFKREQQPYGVRWLRHRFGFQAVELPEIKSLGTH